MSSHAGAETAEAGESREEVIDPLVSSGRGGCGVGGVGNYERYDGRWRSPAPALLPKTNQPAASTAPQLPKVAPRVHSSPKTPGLQTILLRKDFFVCINCIIMKYHVQYFSLRISLYIGLFRYDIKILQISKMLLTLSSIPMHSCANQHCSVLQPLRAPHNTYIGSYYSFHIFYDSLKRMPWFKIMTSVSDFSSP